jgi:hypothetical protein
MEVLAAFLLLLIAIIVVVVGGLLWLVASSLRRRKLASGEDKIDRHMIGTEPEAAGRGERSPGRETAGRGEVAGRERGRERPEHHRVTNEQGSRSIPHA